MIYDSNLLTYFTFSPHYRDSLTRLEAIDRKTVIQFVLKILFGKCSLKLKEVLGTFKAISIVECAVLTILILDSSSGVLLLQDTSGPLAHCAVLTYEQSSLRSPPAGPL